MSNKVKERNTNFIEILKQFWNPDQEEVTQEETISQNEEVSQKTKDILIKSLKIADSIMKPTSEIAKSARTLNPKVNKKEQIQHIKTNPVKIEQEKAKQDKSKGQEIAE